MNGDFVMEGNIDVSSCNENDKGIIDGKINGISGDNCAQYHMKQRFSKKGEVSRIKQKPQRDGNSLDEEVCSVCEVLCISISSSGLSYMSSLEYSYSFGGLSLLCLEMCLFDVRTYVLV